MTTTYKTKTLPLSWRISLHIAAMSTVLAIAVLLTLLPFQQGRVEQESIAQARILAEAVSTIYQHLDEKALNDHARRLLLRVARTPNISMVNIHDLDGKVIYSTDSRELGRLYTVRFGVSRDTPGAIRVTHIGPTHSHVGSVSVFIDPKLMMSETNQLFIQLTIALAAMIFVLMFLIKALIEKLVSSRFNRLMNLIENAEQGSFLIRAEVDYFDEIGHIIVGFNQLLGLITQIEARNIEQEHGQKDALVQKNIRVKLEETLFKLERANEGLKTKVSAQDLLMEAAHSLGGTLKKETVVERLLVLIKEKLTWPQFALFIVDEKHTANPSLKLAASFGLSTNILEPNTKVTMGAGITGIVAQTGSPLLISNILSEKHPKLWDIKNRSISPTDVNDSGSLMAIPMIHKGRVLGVFLFFHPKANIFSNDEMALISALGAQTALALVNAELYETTLELATSDPLTGIMNRRAMVRQIEYELARAQRFNSKVALLLIDVDHFKAYNDRMGHVLGDVALKTIAQELKENIRKVDSLARFGGEEFCVILPQSDITAAREVAFKLCESVRGLKIRGSDKQELGHMSISIGIAIIPDDLDDLTDLDSNTAVTDIIAKADQALYEAKKLGRDRFV